VPFNLARDFKTRDKPAASELNYLNGDCDFNARRSEFILQGINSAISAKGVLFPFAHQTRRIIAQVVKWSLISHVALVTASFTHAHLLAAPFRTTHPTIMAPISIDNGIVIPEEFICRITLEIMEHPLVSRRGCSFERAAIAAWLRQGHNQCPLTRTTLRASDMIHNNHLAARIAKWRAAHGLSPSAATHTKDSFVEKDAELGNEGVKRTRMSND
jgi:U-box domain